MLNLSEIFVISLLLATPARPLANKGDSSYKALRFSGISSKIADLVTETFTSTVSVHPNPNRQDAVTIGEDQSALGSDNKLLMNGFLKVLGFDGRKVGAAAMNGIIFIAQMVRYGANKLMTFLMDRAMDWVSKTEIVNNKTNHVKRTGRRFPARDFKTLAYHSVYRE